MNEQKKYVTRTGVSFEPELLERFDQWIKKKGFPNRSEAIRYIIREYISSIEIEDDPNIEIVGSLTYFFNHHNHDCSAKLTSLQHEYEDIIISTMHSHITHDLCLETIFLRGKTYQVTKFSEEILTFKGVLGGKLYITPYK
ncbi:MAG: nickel-responsive transcriptional regulator NikR [Candidatus Heimdallarchaeaceae archaeon]